MKTILSSWRPHSMKKLGIFLVMVALIAGMVGCEPSCSCTPPLQYDLTIDCTTGGSVTTPGVGTFAYDAGTEINLVAAAEEGYYFVNWTGDVDTIANINAPTTTITMNGDYSITANFEQIPPGQFVLTTSSTAGGSVTTPGEGTFLCDEETVVDLVAKADECYEFVNWTGDTVADPDSATTTITMDEAKTVTANFALLSYDLTADSTDGGHVTTPGEGTSTHDCGTVVDLVAVADECYEFVNWTGDTVADPNSATTTITMDGAKDVTANFALLSYDLTVDSTDDGEVTAPGEGTSTHDCGTVVDLVAEAEVGYSFVEWSGDVGTIADIDAAETTITMSGNYSITANFGPFAGGSGTAEDPYQLADWYHLDNLHDYLSSYFILMSDLDFSSIGYTELASETGHEGKGWEPIGTELYPFAGSLNGQGYEISDLFIDRPDEENIGLVGIIAGSGVIEDIGVVNVDVTGRYYVGGLLGYNNQSTVTDSYSSGSVTGNDEVGGLVGYNDDGTVTNSYSSGSVTGDDHIGGLVGYNDRGTVTNSYSSADVTGEFRVGGLVGRNDDGTVSSYSTGSVTGGDYVGGLVGYNCGAGIVNNSYSSANVTGDDYIGGLVGYIDEGTVSNSHSTGNVTGSNYVGGLVGYTDEGTVSNSFWDTETSGQATSDGGTGKTTVEMKDIATFSGAGWNIIAVANPSTRNLSCIWNIVDDETYPFLSWQPV